MKSIQFRNTHFQEAIAAYILLAPDILGLTLIYVGPILYTFYLAFYSWNGISPQKTYVGFANFAILFQDPIWLKSVIITINYVLLYVPLIIGGALGLALLINSKLPEVKIFRTIYFMPIVMPIIVAAIVWQFIFEPSYGVLNFLFSLFSLPKHAWLGSQNEALFSVVIVTVWKQLGYFMIIFLAGLQDIPREYLEASAVDGATPFQRFRFITLPLLKPTLVFVLVINVIGALQDFDQIYVLTRGGPNYATYVQVYYIYEQAFKFLRMGTASSASVVLFSAILLVSLLQLRILRGGRYD